MKLKFDADMPCGVFLDGKQYVTPFEIEESSHATKKMTVLPVEPDKYSGYSITLSIEDDRLRSASGGVNVVSWGVGLGEVKLTPPISKKTQLPEVIAQRKKGDSQVTVYSDGSPKIMCEGKSFFAKELPYELTDISLKLSEDGLLCSILGMVEDKKYLLALSLFEQNEWKIMHEILADDITVTDKNVASKDILHTMLRHERKCSYKPFEKTPREKTFTPTTSHQYVEELLPYQFLESVAIDSDDCMQLLDSSLDFDFDAIKEFFGVFDTVVSPPFGDYDISVIAVYNSKERISKPDLYKFETKNGKITNIIHLLTCY